MKSGQAVSDRRRAAVNGQDRALDVVGLRAGLKHHGGGYSATVLIRCEGTRARTGAMASANSSLRWVAIGPGATALTG